jgi:endo-1,4-beta-xylanase
MKMAGEMGAVSIPFSFKQRLKLTPKQNSTTKISMSSCCNARINATIDLVKKAIKAGARIDGIGLRGHSRVGSSPSKKELEDTIARSSELVNEVACTEIDIRHTKLPVTAEAREQRAKDCLEALNACLETPMCVAITIWGFTDLDQVYLPESNACTQRRITPPAAPVFVSGISTTLLLT